MVNYYELIKNNPTYFKQFSCKELLFMNYDCPVNVKKVAKWCEYNYVYFVLSGKKTFHAPDQSITLTRGSIVFVKKGACVIEQYFHEPFCIFVFIIPDSFIYSFMREYVSEGQLLAKSTNNIMQVHDDVKMESFCQSIIPYFALTKDIPESILELKFKELLLCIIHNPQNNELYNYFLNIRNQSASSITEIMEANYPYNLQIKDYARLACRSISTFKRDFQLLFKTTPGKWLNEKKINRAKQLLLRDNNNITDVAFDSGFENISHLCRLFKQTTSLTPHQYRKQEVQRNILVLD